MVQDVLSLPLASNICGQQLREMFTALGYASLSHVITEQYQATLLHFHRIMLEIYFIISGNGVLTLGDTESPVSPGFFAIIRSGTPHKLKNTGTEPLVYLVLCIPEWDPTDIVMLEEAQTT